MNTNEEGTRIKWEDMTTFQQVQTFIRYTFQIIALLAALLMFWVIVFNFSALFLSGIGQAIGSTIGIGLYGLMILIWQWFGEKISGRMWTN